MKQLAELYINTNSTSSVEGRKSHGSYFEACQYLNEEGYSFTREAKSNSGAPVEFWYREAPVVVEAPKPEVKRVVICKNLWCDIPDCDGNCPGY